MKERNSNGKFYPRCVPAEGPGHGSVSSLGIHDRKLSPYYPTRRYNAVRKETEEAALSANVCSVGVITKWFAWKLGLKS